MVAALGVLGTGSAWPDLIVASLMASLALHGGWQVMRLARAELKGEKSSADAHGHSHANDHGY
jgi:Co/Zn/Cd efflux system component